MIRYSGLLRLLILATLLLTVGCGRYFSKEDPMETLPVESMYQEAKTSIQNGNYSRATRYYRRLIARFPYGPYTEQAQLELAYAQYKTRDNEEAMSAVNRFIKTYPTNPHIDYAYYLRGLINFVRRDTFLGSYVKLDLTQRDQSSIEQSFNDFAELLRRYPNSRYAADTRQRMVFLRNQMARYEMNVAEYYVRRDAWVAAANRGKYIVEHYPQSEYIPDALAIMALSYDHLGQEQLSADARRVLQLNDPQHPYLASKHWPRSSGWWKRLIPLAGDRR